MSHRSIAEKKWNHKNIQLIQVMGDKKKRNKSRLNEYKKVSKILFKHIIMFMSKYISQKTETYR